MTDLCRVVMGLGVVLVSLMVGCVERRVGCAEILCGSGEPICVSPCDWYEHRGVCYPKTTRCCSDEQCPVGRCNPLTGYCREYLTCTCADDEDCPVGYICHVNHTVCGICTEPPPPCSGDSDCNLDAYCTADGYCQLNCCPD